MRRLVAVTLAMVLQWGASVPAHGFEAPWAPTLVIKAVGRISASAFPDGTAFVTQQEWGEGLQVFKSADFGATWMALPPLPVDGPARVDFSTPHEGLAAVGDDLLRTTDGGGSWQEIESPWAGVAEVDFVEAASDGDTFLVAARPWHDADGEPWGDGPEGGCHDPRLDDLQLFVTRDGGSSWTTRAIRSKPAFADTVDFIDHRHGLVIASADIDYEQTG